MSLSSSLRLIEPRESQAGLAYEPFGIKVYRGEAPTVRPMEIGGDRRMALVVSTPASFGFRAGVPRQGSFRFSVAVRPPRAPVELRLIQRHPDLADDLREHFDALWPDGLAEEALVSLRERMAGDNTSSP